MRLQDGPDLAIPGLAKSAKKRSVHDKYTSILSRPRRMAPHEVFQQPVSSDGKFSILLEPLMERVMSARLNLRARCR